MNKKVEKAPVSKKGQAKEKKTPRNPVENDG